MLKTIRQGYTFQLGILITIQLAMPAVSIAAPPTADSWLHCAPPAPGLFSPALTNQQPDGATRLTADEVQQEGNLYFFRGDVVSREGREVLQADKVDYDADKETALAEGNVRFHRDGQIVSGDSGDFQFAQDTGQITPAKFWLIDRHLRGDASQINIESKTSSTLESARFTTCDEGSNAWWFNTSSVELDTESGQGVAYNALLKIKHVPVFYMPYLSFPIDDRRKSGFLMPSFGHDSLSGNEFSTPYYWNIAPNRDATITPRYMHWRGLLLNGEFRYLNERSQGQVQLGVLSNDKLFNDDRSALDFSHSGEPAEGWTSNVEYRYASDEEYQTDLGNDFGIGSDTHLERRADLGYRGTGWQASMHLQAYQTLDNSIAEISRPYRRLPQFLLSVNEREAVKGMNYGLEASEWVRFDKDAGVVGSRTDLQPYVSWPWYGNAGFLVPKVKYRLTGYQLERTDSAGDDSPTRTVPIFSIDSGLFFERDLQGEGRAKVQTLEPRLFYLYVPHREQSNLIVDESGTSRVFDTSLPGFSLGQMFRDNRFSGADRVGDARQLSFALSSRFLDVDGRQMFNASLGRGYYFQDRLVTLPGGAPETRTSSDWVAAMSSQWTPQLSSSANLLWDTQNNVLSEGDFDVYYKQGQRRVLRTAYRYTRQSQRQIDVAGIWPLASSWNLVARWLHSLEHEVTLESLAGVEYESCCWNLRIVQRRMLDSVTDSEATSSIWLQLELKGLTSVGDRVNDLLARDILAP